MKNKMIILSVVFTLLFLGTAIGVYAASFSGFCDDDGTCKDCTGADTERVGVGVYQINFPPMNPKPAVNVNAINAGQDAQVMDTTTTHVRIEVRNENTHNLEDGAFEFYGTNE
jgi:hypothetical protein